MFTCPDHGDIATNDIISGGVLACPKCNKTVLIQNCTMNKLFMSALAADLTTKKALKEGETLKALRASSITVKGDSVSITFEVLKD